MKASFYKTDKQKRAHLARYWSKQCLFDMVEEYLCPFGCTPEKEDLETWNKIKATCKTKKALLDNYLDLCWEFALEEYSYA